MKASDSLIIKVQSYCKELFERELPEKFVYHDGRHTERVVDASRMIGRESGLSNDELELVTIAAWFHDVGYTEGCDNHELRSAKIARDFLEREGLEEEKIRVIEECIMATQMPQSPKSLLERVLCDADLHHLACTDYDVMAEKMHREIEEVRGKKIKEQEWNDMNFEFFKNHKFHTDFGQKYLQPIKDDNLKKINGEDPMPENKEVKKLKRSWQNWN